MTAVNFARLKQEGFAFQKWRSHAQSRFESWLSQAPQPKAFPAHFWGSDINRKQIARAQENTQNANLPNGLIHWQRADINEGAPLARQWLDNLKLNSDEPTRKALILMNLPYGERLKDDRQVLVKLFRDLGEQLKNHFKGCEAWLLVGEDSPWREIGLKPKQQIRLKNGPIMVKFVQFDLY